MIHAASMAITFSIAMIVACSPPDADMPASPGGQVGSALETVRTEGDPSFADAGPHLVIGGDEAEPESQFDRIVSAAFLGDDRIGISNGGSAEIFVFNRDGTRVMTIGGLGGGPGEFRAPMSAHVLPSPGDTIFVVDPGFNAAKISYFSRTGELLGELISSQESRPRGALLDVAVSPHGTMFFLRQPIVRGEVQNPLFAEVIRFDVRTGHTSKIADVAGPETVVTDLGPVRTFGGPAAETTTEVQPIFGSTSTIAGGGSPFRLVVGTQTDATISVYGEDGNLETRFSVPGEQRIPTSDQIEAARNAFFDSVEGQVAAFKFVGGISSIRERMPVLDRTPVFRTLAVSDNGDIWVERYPLPTDPAVKWWVHWPSGSLRGSAWVPHGLTVLAVNTDYLLARARDDFDIERVEMWPVRIR